MKPRALSPHTGTVNCANTGSTSNSLGDVVIGNNSGTAIKFPSGCYTNSTTGQPCTNSEVGIYGASNIQAYIVAISQAYCNQFNIDVEFVPNVSCQGIDYAADSTSGNAIGLSQLFVPTCTGSTARANSAITDRFSIVDVVDEVERCPGTPAGLGLTPVVVIPQGGSYNAPLPPAGGRVDTCQGQNGAAVADASSSGPTAGTENFCAPNDLSQGVAQIIWNDSLADWGLAGGTSGCAIATQNRAVGAGSRVTWCYNIFNGFDGCQSDAFSGVDTSSITLQLNDICGNPYTGAAPVDTLGTVGYISRADALADPRTGSGGKSLQNCGLISYAGHTGWNGTCNPVASFTPPTLSSTTCPGDADVERDLYPNWSYIHFDVNKSSVTNTAAKSFVTFATTSMTSTVSAASDGFTPLCKMNFSRSADGGPVSASPASC